MIFQLFFGFTRPILAICHWIGYNDNSVKEEENQQKETEKVKKILDLIADEMKSAFTACGYDAS